MPYSSDRSVHIGGNASGTFINTGRAGNIDVSIKKDMPSDSHDTQRQLLATDLGKLQILLKQLKQNNPEATQVEAKAFVTAATPKPVKQRLVSAITSGGKAAIEEFLDNAYVNVALGVIEGWRS